MSVTLQARSNESVVPERESVVFAENPLSPLSSPPMFRYRAVVPDLPSVEDYRPYLAEAHAAEWFSNFGPLCVRFEAVMAEAYGLPGEVCITTSSATAGLSAALLSCERPGPVLAPAFTFPASVGAIRAAGRQAIIMDVAVDTWTIDPRRLEHLLSRIDAAVVMLVAPFGLRRDFSEHIEVCRQHGAAVLIDNAAGLGAERPPRSAAADVWEVNSLHATKPFGIGEGGLMFVHSSCEERVRAALNFSLQAYTRTELPTWGFNGKMSELHAAVALAQARRFAQRLAGRRSFAARYISELGGLEGLSMERQPDAGPWQVYPVLLPEPHAREAAISAAALEGLEVRRYYHPSLSYWPALTVAEPCEVSESLAARMVALPVRSNAQDEEADRIVEIAGRALRLALGLGAVGAA
jgi:dTDP-4-amino-4,6-dideoxygalactose transaminase